MTRETKVGLIVAGSFLCLVCIVVASKWRHGDDPAKDPAEEQGVHQVAAVKPTQSASAPDPKKKEGPKKTDAPPHVVFPALQPHPETKEVAPLTFKPGQLPTMALPPPLPGGNEPAFPVVAPKPDPAPQPKFEFPPPVTRPGELVLPQPVIVDPKTATPTFPIAPDANKNKAPSFPVVKDSDNNKAPTFPIAPAAGVQFPAPQPLAALDVNKAGPPVVPPPLTGAFPGTGKDAKPAFPPIGKDAAPAFPPFSGKDPPPALGPKDLPPAFPPAVGKDGPPAFPMPKPLDTVMPPLGTPMPIPSAPSITPPLDLTKPVMPANPGDAPKVPPIANTPGPIPRIGGSDLPSTPAITMTPENRNAPPIIIGGIKPLPALREVNSDAYTCQTGDTNFAILSKRLYGTEKYADALLAYNRDNYKATVNGSAFLVNPPRLAQGQQIQIAPAAILERDYRPYIGTASVVPTIPASAPPASLARPSPLSAPTNPGIATISNPPSTGKAGTYVVQSPSGESILDIAERVLGDRSQWHKIWRVNQSYQPQFRIPAGTKLEIPAS